MNDIPPDFTPISGKPPEGWTGYIMLRCGFVDRRVIYTRSQINWIHDGGSGDVIAVKQV